MQKLVFAALVWAELGLALGCVFTAGDDDATARFEVSWTIVSDGSATTCAAVGAARVEVVSERIDEVGTYVDVGECGAGNTTTSRLPVGDYSVSLRLLDAADGLLLESAAQDGSLEADGELVVLSEFELDMSPAAETARFAIDWNLTEGDAETEASCSDYGITTIQVISQPTSGSDQIDLFDCADGMHDTALLPLGDYTIWVNAMDDQQSMVAQSSAQNASLDVDGQRVPLTFSFSVDGGFFALTWSLVDDAASAPLTCSEVGADAVSVLSTIVGTTDAYDDLFDCEDGEGVTAKLDIAQYVVVVDILNTNLESLGASEPRTVSIDYGNHLNDLGHFEFAF